MNKQARQSGDLQMFFFFAQGSKVWGFPGLAKVKEIQRKQQKSEIEYRESEIRNQKSERKKKKNSD